MGRVFNTLALLTVVALALTGCQGAVGSATSASSGDVRLRLLVAESFLADIARQVAGERADITVLIPDGVDPHGFEPTPADVRKVAEADIVILNGAGFEAFMQTLLDNAGAPAGGERRVIEAAAGLTSREPREGEEVMAGPEDEHEGEGDQEHEGDPHFWLDPNHVITYVNNIRDGLSAADPAGAGAYGVNADAYIAKLKELDAWIAAQVMEAPRERRLLVTNHESFGYFADRYGFRIVGTVIPSVSTSASPSAQQLARLIDAVKATGAPAVFLETGANSQLAEQIARETGARVVTGLLTHSLGGAQGGSYIEMMRYNVRTIVDALKVGVEK